ncbi:MAG: glycosyltransferase family 2 protein [Candidatus Omnitrophota bacterium]
MIDYSVVIPVYNEEESLDPLMQELEVHIQRLEGSYEIVFVNDGSSDRSLTILERFQMNHPECIRIINLSGRKKQTLALCEGLYAAQGRVVITLDADLQNDPADIPALIKKMDEGYDVVCGWRKNRMDTPLKMALSKLGNILQRLFTGMKIHDISCTLRAYKKECIDQLHLTWEGQHRFIPLLLAQKGFKIGEIISHHRKRQHGYSKYSHKRIFKVMLDFFKIIFSKGRQ